MFSLASGMDPSMAMYFFGGQSNISIQTEVSHQLLDGWTWIILSTGSHGFFKIWDWCCSDFSFRTTMRLKMFGFSEMSPTIEWIIWNFDRDMDVPLRIKCNNFNEQLTFNP